MLFDWVWGFFVLFILGWGFFVWVFWGFFFFGGGVRFVHSVQGCAVLDSMKLSQKVTQVWSCTPKTLQWG